MRLLLTLLAACTALAQSGEVRVVRRTFEYGVHLGLSADGKTLAYSVSQFEPKQNQIRYARRVVDLSTNEETSAGGKIDFITGIAMSPNSNEVYSVQGTYLGQMAILRGTREGGVLTPVIKSQQTGRLMGYLAFSPDGKSLAFFRTTNDGATRVITAAVDGAGERELHSFPGTAPVRGNAGPASLEGVAWSPDGSEIAVGYWQGANSKLIAVSSKTGAIRDLLPLGEEAGPSFAWPPQGGGLYIVRGRQNNNRLSKYDFASNQWSVIDDGGSLLYRPHLSVSADGSTIAAMRLVAGKPENRPWIAEQLMGAWDHFFNPQAQGNMEVILLKRVMKP